MQQFIEAREKWAAENPEAAEAADAARRQAAAADGAAHPDGEMPAAEPAQPEQRQDGEANAGAIAAAGALPEAFAQALEKDAALKTAFNANPEALALVMESARTAERMRAVEEIFSTREEAEFAQGHANTMLDLRHNFLLGVEDPEAAAMGWNGLKEQFRETDEKGNPVNDAAGNPVYGRDFETGLLTPAATEKVGSLATGARAKAEELKQRAASGVFPNEAAKAEATRAAEEADLRASAAELVAEMLKGDGAEPGLPELDPDATPAQRAYQERLRKEREELDGVKKTQGREAQAKTTREFEGKMRLTWQAGVGESIDNFLKEARERGEVIPDYILTRKWIDPVTKQQTTVPSLAVEILNEYDARVNSIPGVKDKLQQLQRLGPAGEQQRAAYNAELREKYLGPIMKRHVKEIQDGIRASQTAEQQRREELNKVARPEAKTSSAGAPEPLTPEQLQKRAQELAQKDPEWATADSETRTRILMVARTRVQYGY